MQKGLLYSLNFAPRPSVIPTGLAVSGSQMATDACKACESVGLVDSTVLAVADNARYCLATPVETLSGL